MRLTYWCLARVFAVCALVGPLCAQWIHYPTAGVPRTSTGAPDLKARPRRTGGKPDLSGMWAQKYKPLPCNKITLVQEGECIEKDVPSSLANDLAIEIPGGLPYQPWAAELVKKRSAQGGTDDPHSKCLPLHVPRSHTLPHIQKFVQTPGLLIILDEFNASYRQIFTDGRPLPVDPQPAWNGYSTGHWEGDTLVVKTIGFRDDLWLDGKGNPLTEAATLTERFGRPNFGTMEIDLTVDDPKAYTRPWTVKLNLSIVLDTEMMDEICLENEKSMQHMPAK